MKSLNIDMLILALSILFITSNVSAKEDANIDIVGPMNIASQGFQQPYLNIQLAQVSNDSRTRDRISTRRNRTGLPPGDDKKLSNASAAYQACLAERYRKYNPRFSKPEAQLALAKCEKNFAQQIAEVPWSNPESIRHARAKITQTAKNAKNIVDQTEIKRNNPSHKAIVAEIEKLAKEIEYYFVVFDRSYASTSKKENRNGVLRPDGIRYYSVDYPKDGKVSVALIKSNTSIGSGFDCTKKNAPEYCLIQFVKADGSVAESYFAQSTDSLLFIKLPSPDDKSLIDLYRSLPFDFKQIPNLIQSDFEAIKYSFGYEYELQKIYFWFETQYAENCGHLVQEKKAISGVWESVNTATNTVEGRREYYYEVEASKYLLARKFHDQHINYQIMGMIPLNRQQDGMRNFFERYSCESKEIQSIHAALGRFVK